MVLTANVAIGAGEKEMAVDVIGKFADIAFTISPFAPARLIENWKEILHLWLLGRPVTDALVGDSDEAIQFIEQAFVYNLPWAMEAVRVRATAHEDVFSKESKLSDYPRAHAVAALETGALSISAATLIQAGFASRIAAIRAVEVTGAAFDSTLGLKAWLRARSSVGVIR